MHKIQILAFGFLLFSASIKGATITSTGAGGAWSAGGSWVGGIAPAAGDDVIIATGATINLTSSPTCLSLTINGTGILNLNTAAQTLTITNALTLNNTSSIQGAGSNRIINAATFTVSVGANTTVQDIQLNIAGLAQINGTVAFNTGATAAKSFGSMTINAGTLNIATNAVTLGVVDALTLSGAATIQGASNTRIINAGSLSVSAAAAAIIQQVQLNVTNLAQVDGTLTFNTGIATKTFGSLTINGTFTNTAFVNPLTINGSMVNNGTFSQGTGRVTFTGATSNTVTGTAVTTAFGGGITINKGVSQANILDVQCVITMVNGGLTLTNGTFKLTSASTIVPFTADPGFGTTARLWCNGGTMNSTVSTDWTFNGTLQVSTGTVNFGFAIDDRLIPNNGSIGTVDISGGALNVTGRLTGIGASWTYIMTNGVLTTGTLGNTAFNPFSMTTAGSTFSMSGGTIIIERAATGNGGYINSSTLGTGFIGGTLQIGDASTPAASTIGVNTTIPIYNLQINSANATAQVQTQAITVSNNVTISLGTLTANTFGITVGGNWINNGTFTPTAPAAGVTFNSSTQSQTIGGTASTSFYRLTLNNTFATMPQIVLGINTVATNRLTMTSGVVNLAGFSFTISSNVTGALSHALASTNGWMYGGNFIRAVPTTAIALLNVDGFFPVGTLVDFRPFFMGKNNIAGSAGNITVSHTRVPTVSTVVIVDASAGTTIISRRDDFWSVSHSGTTGTYGIRYGGTGLGVVFSLAHLHSCLAASVVATHIAASTVSLTDPRVERSALTFANFNNNFYVGSDNLLSTLPIELLDFGAVVEQGAVKLNWSTASELNNDFFTVERASDIEKFEAVATVKGQGTKGSRTDYSSMDRKPLAGTSYYRLKQTDFDGVVSYSKIVSVEVSESLAWVVYPNPSNGTEFTISLSPSDIGKQAFIKVQDIGGKELLQLTTESLISTQVKIEPAQKLSPGLYIISIAVEQQVVRQKLLVR